MKGSMLVTRVSAALVAVVAGYVSYLHIVDAAMDVGERPEVAYARLGTTTGPPATAARWPASCPGP